MMRKGNFNQTKKIANVLGVIAVILAILLSTATPATALNHTLDGVSGTVNAQSCNIDAFSGTINTQSGTINVQSGAVNNQSGTINTQSGTVNVQSGSLLTESGTINTQSGSVGQDSGTINTQSGTINTQSGTVNAQSGTINTQSGTINVQSGTVNAQSGTINTQSGTVNVQSGTVNMQSGTINAQSGTIEGFSGTVNVQSGTINTQSGAIESYSGTINVQSGTVNMQSWTTDVSSGTINVQSGMLFIYSGTINTQSGTVNVQSGTVNMQSGTINTQSGTISVQSGSADMSSGTINTQSGTINVQSGTINAQSGTINTQSGTIQGFSGTVNVQSGTINAQSGTVEAFSGTINVQSGTVSNIQGTVNAQSGTINVQSARLDILSGTVNTQSGTVNVQSGTVNVQSGTINTQSGTVNVQSGTINTQSGTVNAQSGTVNVQSGTINTQSGTINTQSGIISITSGTVNAQSGTVNAQSGKIDGFSGTVNVQSGTITTVTGAVQEFSGTVNVQSGTINTQSGTVNAQSGTMGMQSGTLYIRSGTINTQSGTVNVQSGTVNMQSGTVNVQSGTINVQSGTVNAQSGTVNVQSGTINTQSGTVNVQSGDTISVLAGTVNAQSGTVNAQSGTIDRFTGTVNVQSGTINTQSGHHIEFSGTINVQSGTVNVQSGTINTQSGTINVQSGTLLIYSGTINTQSGTVNVLSGTVNVQSGTINTQSGTVNAQSGCIAVDPTSLAADASVGQQGKWFNLTFLDEPVAPTLEGTGYFDFTPNPASYNNVTGLFRASAATGTLRQKYQTGYRNISLQITQLDYNNANYRFNYDSYADMVVKGKFTLATPLTAADLDPDDWRNRYVEDFSVDRGEFHLVMIGSGPGYGDGNNSQVYGRIYFYGTYKGEDMVLVTDFMNQLDFSVQGLGDCCHPTADGKYHVEGDWYCYPGAYFMGWRESRLWSYGDTTISSTGTGAATFGYSTDYVYMPWLTQQLTITGNGFNNSWTVANESYEKLNTSKTNSFTVPRSQLPSTPGVYTGEVAAYMNDGYVGINGYSHFKLVVSSQVSSINVNLTGMTDVHSAQMVATFTPMAIDALCDWDWGDGTVNTVSLPAGSGTSTDLHTYAQAGEYPVKAILHLSDGTILARKSYCSDCGHANYPWYQTAPDLYQQYVGVNGISEPAISQWDNYVIARAYFSDNSSPGTYTAKVYWGDDTYSMCGMYGYNNRLVYDNATGQAFQDAVSGRARGGHVYKTTGLYDVRIIVYKDGAEYASVYTKVDVETVHPWPANTVYTGQLGDGHGLPNVYYSIDWGDGTTPYVHNYAQGGLISVPHNYQKGGLFTVTASFWMDAHPTDQLIARWQYDTLGVITRGVDVNVGGADIVSNGTALGSRDVSMGDTFTMSADFPTNVSSSSVLSAIFYWGDDISSMDVTPDANGIVHCEASHVYSRQGIFTPRIELVLDARDTIGFGTSDPLDIRCRPGALEAAVSGSGDSITVQASASLPADTSGWGNGWSAAWTLINVATNQHIGPASASTSGDRTSGTFTGIAGGQTYSLRLDILDSAGEILNSEVYYYVNT